MAPQSTNNARLPKTANVDVGGAPRQGPRPSPAPARPPHVAVNRKASPNLGILKRNLDVVTWDLKECSSSRARKDIPERMLNL